MLQGWNKFCYSGGGYVEVSVSLPGRSDVSGLWPSVWTVSLDHHCVEVELQRMPGYVGLILLAGL